MEAYVLSTQTGPHPVIGPPERAGCWEHREAHQRREAWPPPAGEQGGDGRMWGSSLFPGLLPETLALVLTLPLMFWVTHLHFKEGQVLPSS